MFFKTMKRSLLLLFVASIFLTSCSEYQRVLRDDNVGKKYALADSLYDIGKYKKALVLMEQVVPSYRGKPQAEKLMYMYANTFYNLEDFYLAGYQFERFETSYPKSDSVETASFKSAISYYELSPRYSLDQNETITALEKLQSFVNKYPDTEKRAEVNEKVSTLRGKLEKKDYEVAKQYLRISDFKAAIIAYENFISDHPGSSYRKDAFYGRMDAAYLLAINSVPSKVAERLNTAQGYYKAFLKYYNSSDLIQDAAKISLDIDKRLSAETPLN
ncbi:MAG: outer membrane protein assembly factor BamD [Candidatus Latescibacterota bacterium]|jgi:outer membrane protein assembly factor BamD